MENNLYEAQEEQTLLRAIEQIEDRIYFGKAIEQEVVDAIKSLLQIDMLRVQYETREAILHMFCEAVESYDLKEQIDWNAIEKVKSSLESNLQEYVEEIV